MAAKRLYDIDSKRHSCVFCTKTAISPLIFVAAPRNLDFRKGNSISHLDQPFSRFCCHFLFCAPLPKIVIWGCAPVNFLLTQHFLSDFGRTFLTWCQNFNMCVICVQFPKISCVSEGNLTWFTCQSRSPNVVTKFSSLKMTNSETPTYTKS